MSNDTAEVARSRAWKDVSGKPIDCVARFDRHIVGYSHPNKNGLDRLPFLRGLTKGTRLVLVPEPMNSADRNAILVYVEGDLENDIGYLDAVGARMICPLLERGATFSAEVFYVYYDKPDRPITRILIYQLTPALEKHRPIRKGAPAYKLQPPERTKHEIASVPLSSVADQVDTGFWSRLRRLFFD